MLFSVLSLLLIGSSWALVEVEGPFNYHATVGIPAAEKRREFEEQILKNNTEGALRIVGGFAAATNAQPHLAGLLINFVNIAGQSACGSSILSANRLLTAAHCWFDGVNQASQFTVVFGSHFLFSGGTRIATSNVVMHPQWTPTTLANDVAIIYMPSNIFFTASIQPVSLPSTLDLAETFVGQTAVAAGYGRTSDAQASITTSSFISQVSLPVIANTQCQAVFGNIVLASNICTNGAGGVGICGGDSGGPLTINRNGQNVLVGVSSFVAANGCQLGFPSAFARVTSFYSFIVQHLL